MKVLKWSGAALLLITLLAAVYVLQLLRSFEVESLNNDLHVVRGVGGNATVLKTTAGAVVIDSMTFTMQGRLLHERAKQLTGEDVVLLINTHYHLDHTHGNPGFAPGTRVIATERTSSHLQYFDSENWESASSLAPNETFTEQLTLELGDKTLHLIHPGPGHTDGDLVVIIEQADTIVMGDLFFNQHYPNIDLEAGGSVRQWANTLDDVLSHSFTRVIPGHGATTDRLGLLEFQRFIGQLANIGQAAAADGLTLDQVLGDDALNSDKGFTPISFGGIPIGLDRDFVLRRTWEESTGNFQRLN